MNRYIVFTLVIGSFCTLAAISLLVPIHPKEEVFTAFLTDGKISVNFFRKIIVFIIPTIVFLFSSNSNLRNSLVVEVLKFNPLWTLIYAGYFFFSVTLVLYMLHRSFLGMLIEVVLSLNSVVVLLCGLLMVVFEETFFRSFVYSIFAPPKNVSKKHITSAIISWLLFVAMHLPGYYLQNGYEHFFPYLFILGLGSLLIVMIYHMTRNLFLVIFYHLLLNIGELYSFPKEVYITMVQVLMFSGFLFLCLKLVINFFDFGQRIRKYLLPGKQFLRKRI